MTHSPNFAFVYIFEHVSTTRDSYRVTGELNSALTVNNFNNILGGQHFTGYNTLLRWNFQKLSLQIIPDKKLASIAKKSKN